MNSAPPRDLHLSAGSPCIDAGDNTAVPTGIVTDLDGNARFRDDPSVPDTGVGPAPVVDMGAYEFAPDGTGWWSNYGVGYPGANGIPAFTSRDDPVIGASITLDLENSAGVVTSAFLLLGLAPTSLDTNLGGTLLVQVNAVFSLGIPSGGLALSDSIPNDPAFDGVAIYLQVLENDAGATNGFSFTAGLELHIGT